MARASFGVRAFNVRGPQSSAEVPAHGIAVAPSAGHNKQVVCLRQPALVALQAPDEHVHCGGTDLSRAINDADLIETE